jgi:hypothetical protein
LKIFILLFAVLFALAGFASHTKAQSKDTYKQTVKLLSKMDKINSKSTLRELFKTGDERIEDLIKALEEKNKTVSLHAQRVIRYLGNPQGVKGLFDYYEKLNQITTTNPIPLPLADWDYKVITNNEYVDCSYVYALLFDNSERAKSLLTEILKKPSFLSDGCSGIKADSVENFKTKLEFPNGSNLAKRVSENAFFVCEADKKYIISKLMAFNEAKNKALIYLKIDRGVLAEEWYHIVISKTEKGWKFFSVTQVAVS